MREHLSWNKKNQSLYYHNLAIHEYTPLLKVPKKGHTKVQRLLHSMKERSHSNVILLALAVVKMVP